MTRNSILWLHVLVAGPEPTYVLRRMTVDVPSKRVEWQGRTILVATDADGKALEKQS